MASVKNDRTRAIKILYSKLEPLKKQLSEADTPDNIILYQSEIIGIYFNFMKILEIIENIPTGQGNKGDRKLLNHAKETYSQLEGELARKPKNSEFKKRFNAFLKSSRLGFNEGDIDKNIERLYKKLSDPDFWLMENLKSIYLENNK